MKPLNNLNKTVYGGDYAADAAGETPTPLLVQRFHMSVEPEPIRGSCCIDTLGITPG